MKALRSQGVNGELRTCGEMEGSYGVARIALVARETLDLHGGVFQKELPAKTLNAKKQPNCSMSDFCGEIEESCLLVCHFYLPKERADTYGYKSPIGQVSFS
jgi:hypothetical protein